MPRTGGAPRARYVQSRHKDHRQSSSAQRAALNWRLAVRGPRDTIGAMIDDISRRDWLKAMSVAGAGALIPFDAVVAEADRGASMATTATHHAPGDIVELTSTSEIFIPPRGRSYMKFSFDFPEPSVAFGDYRFGFLVFTDENTYGLDRTKLRVEGSGDAIRLDRRRIRLGRRSGEGAGQAHGLIAPNWRERSNGMSSPRWTGRSRRSRRSSAAFRADKCRSAAVGSPICATASRSSAIRSAAATSTRRAA